MRSTWTIWLILAFIVLALAGLRVRLLATPLERDEGEYAYLAQLILQGELPYAQAYTMKYPGVAYSYALILAVFGQTDVGIHLGLLVINAASIVLVFLLGKRLFDPATGLCAAGAFGLFSLSRTMLGFTANAEHFVILPMLAATLMLLRAVEQQRRGLLLGSSVLFGLAVLMKQHAALFAAFGAVYLLIETRQQQRQAWPRVLLHLLLFCAGTTLPLTLLGLYLWANGAFAPFWFWTFTYPRHYTSMVSFGSGLARLGRIGVLIGSSSAALWVLAIVGATAMIWDGAAKSRPRFLALFAGFSFLSICPGLLFRSHYFLLLVPAASLLAGVGAAALGRLCGQSLSPSRASATVAVLAVVLTLFQASPYLFWQSSEEIIRQTYYPNPFLEMKELAHYVRANSTPDDRIAVIGSEPQMFFYAQRRAATNFIYVYPLMEPQPYALQMQQEMIAEIERAALRFLAIVPTRFSWLPNADSPRLILEWPKGYVAANYRRVCVADIVSPDLTEYRWGKDAIAYTPRGVSFVVLYERLPAG